MILRVLCIMRVSCRMKNSVRMFPCWMFIHECTIIRMGSGNILLQMTADLISFANTVMPWGMALVILRIICSCFYLNPGSSAAVSGNGVIMRFMPESQKTERRNICMEAISVKPNMMGIFVWMAWCFRIGLSPVD